MDKRIEWNREDKGFDLYLGGRYVGSASTPSQAQRRLDEMAAAALVHEARLTPVPMMEVQTWQRL